MRAPSNDEHFCIRRIPATSSHWRPAPENRATSAAYEDESGEVSVDLFEDQPSDLTLNQRYEEIIAARGVGFCRCKVAVVRSALAERQISDSEVLDDPVPGNDRHGVITHINSRSRQKLLSRIFEIVVEPKTIQQQFGN